MHFDIWFVELCAHYIAQNVSNGGQTQRDLWLDSSWRHVSFRRLLLSLPGESQRVNKTLKHDLACEQRWLWNDNGSPDPTRSTFLFWRHLFERCFVSNVWLINANPFKYKQRRQFLVTVFLKTRIFVSGHKWKSHFSSAQCSHNQTLGCECCCLEERGNAFKRKRQKERNRASLILFISTEPRWPQKHQTTAESKHCCHSQPNRNSRIVF